MDKRLGAQLYTVRELCKTKEDFEKTMKALAEIGFKTAQLSGVPEEVSRDPDYVRAVCDNYGIKIVATHLPYARYVDDLEEAVSFNKKLGVEVAGIGSAPIELRRDLPTLRETIKKCNEINRRLEEEGMVFGWHNHSFEFARVDGDKSVMDVILEEGNFTLILDTYWLAYVGIDPARFIKKNGEKVSILHYKDLLPLPDIKVEYCEVGRGNILWDEVVEASVAPRYAMIEQDYCHDDPLKCLERSYKYLTTNFDFE